MVILIAGGSHTGKTLLAQRLLERYHYPYLSIDHLKMGLIRSGQTRLTPEDDRELTDYLWPIVREMVKTAIENRQNLIVEGCYIPFDWKESFSESYLAEIRYLCLVMSGTSGSTLGRSSPTPMPSSNGWTTASSSSRCSSRCCGKTRKISNSAESTAATICSSMRNIRRKLSSMYKKRGALCSFASRPFFAIFYSPNTVR